MTLAIALSMCAVGGVAARTPTPEQQWTELLRGASLAVSAESYADAQGLMLQAYRLAQRQFGREDLRTAESLRILGYLHLAAQEHTQAVHYFHRALAIMEAKAAPHDPSLALVLLGMIEVAMARRQSTMAEALCQRAILIREHAFGPRHPSVAEVLVWLAKVQLARGHISEARRTAVRACAMLIGRHAVGADAARVFALLGELETIGQRWDRALSYYQHAVTLHERAKTLETPEATSTFHALARVFRSAERPGEAQAASRFIQAGARRGQEAYRSWRSTHRAWQSADGPPERVTVSSSGPSREESLQAMARTLTERAALYAGLGETGESTRLFRQAVEVYQRLYPEDVAAAAAAFVRHREDLLKAGRDTEARFVTLQLPLIGPGAATAMAPSQAAPNASEDK